MTRVLVLCREKTLSYLLSNKMSFSVTKNSTFLNSCVFKFSSLAMTVLLLATTVKQEHLNLSLATIGGLNCASLSESLSRVVTPVPEPRLQDTNTMVCFSLYRHRSVSGLPCRLTSSPTCLSLRVILLYLLW